ncbi:pro-neuregulin-4, membrane-bound isoform isoform X1 [Alligator sinensis]|uniref:Pro-neuregulin-4, membrane-bound isoform n=1 Tax=Alligator sinensis TaxID=38654 RepID=A0A3Q0GWN8_ALLSI|nr:pro-neuregulin-4, membrane-bound isoform isoform X1 [Alligator sinensis]XP_025064181.1 pro-neuregulin-4, membrane-bound isoform isoform X1 [Alligator sinensis]
MRTDHEELCGTSYGSFCLNGGICYMVPTVSSPFCRCIENYTGARCEEVLLPNIKTQATVDLFAAFLASVVLLGVLVIGTFYFFCRRGSLKSWSSDVHSVPSRSSPGQDVLNSPQPLAPDITIIYTLEEEGPRSKDQFN